MLINILLLITSLSIGSFLGLVIFRLPRRESLLGPASHCPHCQRQLAAWELIPLASYVWLRGRCRNCSQPISPRYPLVEVITALCFFIIYMRWGLSAQTAVGWIFTSALIVAAFIDIEKGIIPDRLTYPGMVTGLLLSFVTIGPRSSLSGLLLYGSVLLAAALLSRGGMGGGDIKMAALIGSFLGWPGSILALFLSSLLGGIWAAGLLVSSRATRKSAIKFGPFLSLGAWMVFVYGQPLLDFYLSLY